MTGSILNSELVKKYISSEKRTFIVLTPCNEAIKEIGQNNNQLILHSPINNIRYINKFFEEINLRLENNGLFIGSAETAEVRKQRVLKKYSFIINYFIYLGDFIFHRVFPKLFSGTRYLYFFITKGKSRVLPKAEIFGRLYSCGFKIVEYSEAHNTLTFVVQKVRLPHYDPNPSFGPLFKMKRIGKDGLIVNVYKLRTMHAYSEYLQSYINDTNGLDEGGKFKDDFRVSSYGKFFRKFWIDELPMIINFLWGDIKLVGVRPISKHYFDLFSEELKQLRLRNKPGLIPPFYVDLPKTLEEIMESEKKYLMAFEKDPFKTDVSYFKQSFKNIFFKRIRSK